MFLARNIARRPHLGSQARLQPNALRLRLFLHPPRGLATLADEVRSDDTFHIPVVDFGKYLCAQSAAEKEKTASEVVGAFKEASETFFFLLALLVDNFGVGIQVGFVYLKNHGVPDAAVKNVFQKVGDILLILYGWLNYLQSAKFFELPFEKKASYSLSLGKEKAYSRYRTDWHGKVGKLA